MADPWGTSQARARAASTATSPSFASGRWSEPTVLRFGQWSAPSMGANAPKHRARPGNRSGSIGDPESPNSTATRRSSQGRIRGWPHASAVRWWVPNAQERRAARDRAFRAGPECNSKATLVSRGPSIFGSVPFFRRQATKGSVGRATNSPSPAPGSRRRGLRRPGSTHEPIVSRMRPATTGVV